MADEGGFDPCECIWNNDAVQRLLYFLRQTQTHCTENECYPVTRLPGPSDGQSSDFLFVTMILGFLALLYAFRPSALRKLASDDMKTYDNRPNSNDPPAPPPAAN